jgi:Mlc titration factor MtfA (ptsG expression regulator)
MFGFTKRRRKNLRAQPFPNEWLAIIHRNVPYYNHLTPVDQQELRGTIQVFMVEKNFEGCGGLTLTDEIKVTIAAYACILLLRRQHNYYPRLKSILVYPDSYQVEVRRQGPSNMVEEGVEERAGESWHTGAVVVSWNHALRRPGDPQGGHNVILHEFAHQLDQENGPVDGAPSLPQTSMYATWAKVLGREYHTLVAEVEAGYPTLIDVYGTKNPAEFFAVVTEHFFEQPLTTRCHVYSLCI